MYFPLEWGGEGRKEDPPRLHCSREGAKSDSEEPVVVFKPEETKFFEWEHSSLLFRLDFVLFFTKQKQMLDSKLNVVRDKERKLNFCLPAQF
jgi:hypothetical protein